MSDKPFAFSDSLPFVKAVFAIVAILFCVCGSNLFAAEDTLPDSSNLQVIAAPGLGANSDEGISVGFTVGMANYPDLLAYIYGLQSTKGYTSFGIKGEGRLKLFRVSSKINLSRVVRGLYEDNQSTPEPYARATVSRFQFDVSFLRQLSTVCQTGVLEWGPQLVLDISKGAKPRDKNDESIALKQLPRFHFGSLAQIGPRFRYRTTSVQRPLDGVLIDASMRLGRASGEELQGADLDAAVELMAALARPLSPRYRLYLRALGRWQHAASAPNRYWLGGEKTLRGQPDQREFGRRVLSGRAQVYHTLIPDWGFPLRLAHSIWSIFPVWNLDIETTVFFDVGAVGDPEFGWLRTRQGYGAGFRFVVPPELLLFFDVAKSPHGDVRYYMGMGETL